MCQGTNVHKLISSTSINTAMLRDTRGNPIWFPKDGNPYYDKALRKTFISAKQKQKWMKDNEIIMDGSSDPIKWPEAAGDMKNRDYRRKLRMED